MLDLGPAARAMADLVTSVPDDALDRPTPCPAYRLGDLLEHVGATGRARWDVARACGQRYEVDPPALTAVHGFLRESAEASPEGTPGLFGPAVSVPDEAPLLDRVVGLAGRDPAWSPRAADAAGAG